ncbi:hypothetical protein SAMN02910369_02543 [Lachnospiraceae bacterium NE2001]|nr:hypothetical protein SAMN02910369_02543 [Lachnospiraceae bacterium NE2001]
MEDCFFNNIGFSCKKDDEKQIKRLLEIIGVDFSASLEPCFCMNFDYFSNACMGRNNTSLGLDEIFSILNRSFEEFILLGEYEDYESWCDRHIRHEEVYDSKTNKIYIGDNEYCYGNMTMFGHSVYDLIKEECERKALERDVPVKWKEYDLGVGVYPVGADFSDICEDVLDEKGDLEELGQKTEIKNITIVNIAEEKIKKIIDEAAKYGYEDIVQLLNDSFDLKYNPSRPAIIKHKPNQVQRYFADMIDHFLESWDSYTVEDLVNPCDKEMLNNIGNDEYLQIRNIRWHEDYHDYILDYYYNDKYLGTARVPTDGILGGALELKVLVSDSPVYTGKKSLWYEYRFLNLDYKAIKKHILRLFSDEVDKIEVIDEYKTGDPENDYISREDIKKITIKKNDSGDSLKAYNYENKKKLIDVARRFGIDYLKFDIQE